MPTTEIKTIKPAGGGDYASINAWEAAERADLVAADKIKVAEVYSGGNSVSGAVTIGTGWTTDATRYPEIRAASASRHVGIYTTNKAYMRVTGGSALFSISNSIVVHFTGMQMVCDAGGSNASGAGGMGVSGNGSFIIEGCICKATGSTRSLVRTSDNGGFTSVIRNSFLIHDGAFVTAGSSQSCASAGSGSTTLNIYNSVLITLGADGVNGQPINIGSAGTINSQNNYLRPTPSAGGANDRSSYFSSGGTINQGANDASSSSASGTGTGTGGVPTSALRSIAYSTANFNIVTSGSEDLHIPKTSALVDQGANLFATGVTLDIDGQDRPSGGTFDIGADEIPTFATIIKSIKAGGGGDYTDLASWITARKGNLIIRNTLEVAEIYGGGSVGNLIILNGDWTTDAINYIHVRAATGEEHVGIFDANKAYIQAVSEDIGIQIEKGFTRVGPGICVESQGAPGTFLLIDVIVGDAPVIFDSLIVKDNSNDDTLQTSTHNATTLAHIIKNCVMYKTAAASSSVVTSQSQANTKVLVYNCTLICGSSKWPLYAPSGTITSENCYLKAGTDAYSDGGSGTIVKGNNDATSNGDATNPSLRNIAHSIANFQNVTFATADYHLKAGSALIDAGADLTSQDITTDYEGETRDALFDIGADEFMATSSGNALLLACW